MHHGCSSESIKRCIVIAHYTYAIYIRTAPHLVPSPYLRASLFKASKRCAISLVEIIIVYLMPSRSGALLVRNKRTGSLGRVKDEQRTLAPSNRERVCVFSLFNLQVGQRSIKVFEWVWRVMRVCVMILKGVVEMGFPFFIYNYTSWGAIRDPGVVWRSGMQVVLSGLMETILQEAFFGYVGCISFILDNTISYEMIWWQWIDDNVEKKIIRPKSSTMYCSNNAYTSYNRLQPAFPMRHLIG